MAEKLSDKVEQDEVKNPASLSMDPTKKVPRDKPQVKPPLKDVPMTRLLTYLSMGLAAIVAFYLWRITIWASDAGGYWNLMTGTRPEAAAARAGGVGGVGGANPASVASMADSAVGSKVTGRSGGKSVKGKTESIESQITRLADALGISPADLSAAIRPYLDPTVPNPNEANAAAAAAAAAAEVKKEPEVEEPGLFGVVGEMVLD